MNVDLNRLRQLRSQRFDPTETRPRESYFTAYGRKSFDRGNVAERYHENTKLTPTEEFELGPAAGTFTGDPSLAYAQARLRPDHADAELVELPPTEGIDDRFDTVVVTRRSQRDMAGEGVSLQDLSTLLQHACGVTGRDVVAEDTDEHDAVEKPFRSYASAGGLYPVEVYVAVVAESAELARGLYYYVPEEHAVRVLDRETDAVDAVDDVISIPRDVHDPTDAGVVVFLAGAMWRAMAKYGPRGYRFVLQESGHLAQNLQLTANALGLASVPLAAFYDDEANAYLGVNGVDEATVYAISVGQPTTEVGALTDEDAHAALDVEYPAFNPTVVPAQLDENTVHVRAGPWSGPILTISDTEEDASLTTLVDCIDGETHVEDVLDAFAPEERDEVLDALAALAESNVVYDASEGAEDVHQHLAMRHRFRQQDAARVEEQTVAVVGDGEMTRHVVEDVLAFGVADVGVVELDDDAALSRFRDRDAFESFDRSELESVVAASDFVVYAGVRPRPAFLADLNAITHETNTPWVLGQVLGFDGIVGPAVFPGETACYECFEERTLANVSNREGYVGYAAAVEADDHLAARSLPMFSRAVAGYLALDVLHLLAFGVGFTAGSVVTVSSLDCATTTEDVLRLPRCPTCGVDPDAGPSPFVSLEDVVHADHMQGGE